MQFTIQAFDSKYAIQADEVTYCTKELLNFVNKGDLWYILPLNTDHSLFQVVNAFTIEFEKKHWT